METLRALNQERLDVAERLLVAISEYETLRMEMDKSLAAVKSLAAEAERMGWSKKDLSNAGVKLPGERRRSPAARKNRTKRTQTSEVEINPDEFQSDHNHE